MISVIIINENANMQQLWIIYVINQNRIDYSLFYNRWYNFGSSIDIMSLIDYHEIRIEEQNIIQMDQNDFMRRLIYINTIFLWKTKQIFNESMFDHVFVYQTWHI